jgi:mono/diheme cytochrome c family protein
MSGALRRFLLTLLLIWVWTACLPVPCRAQQEADEEEPFLPGLAANYRDAQGHTASRLDYQLAFHWGELPPDPRLTAGEFRATWQGNLLTAPRGAYRFFVFGSGEVEWKIAGRAVIPRQIVRSGWLSSPAVTLTADYQPLEVSFRQTEKDARLMLFWSGPDFGLEPIPPRFLFHPREKAIDRDFERGRLLARVLRCGKCHNEEPAPPPAPALDRLCRNISRDWLVRWLTDNERAGEERSPRRMPAFGLSATQAEALADWLLEPRGAARAAERRDVRSHAERGNEGERLFVSLGCLACHSWRDLGASGWLGGGDLTHIADKRPADFFAVWLDEPARLNRDHRMPVFQLSNKERASLGQFLAAQKSSGERSASAGLPTPHQPADAGRSPFC